MSNTVTTQTGSSGVQDKAGAAADTAAQQASEVAGTAKQQASEVAGVAREQAGAVVGDAKHQARRIVDDSRQHLREQAGEQSRRAAGSVRDVGDQIRRMVDGEGAPEGPVGDLARHAADSAQRLADTLEQRRPEELLDDVRRFARQRPGMFVLGALGAGFVVGRLLRSADTSSLGDAARSAMSGEGDESGQSGQQGQQASVSGPGTVAGSGGTGELHPPRAEPLRASTLDAGLDTGTEL